MDNMKRRAVVSLLCSYIAQFATTASSLAMKLILARLLAPQDVGLFAMASLVMMATDLFLDLGLSQNVARDDRRPYGNQLLIRTALSIILFAALEIGAPVLSRWDAELPLMIRVMAFTLLIKASSGVASLYLDRELLVQKSLLPHIIRLALSGVASIVLAYYGYGVWALVWGGIISDVVFSALIWIAARGRVRLELTWRYTRQLLWDSRFLFLIALMGFGLQQGDVAIVGTLIDKKTLGFYSMAYTLVGMVSKIVETSIYRVIYPMFCEHKDRIADLGRIYRLATLAIVVVEAPIYFYLLFNGRAAVVFLLGRKWLEAGVIVQLLSVAGTVNPFSTFGYEVLRATRRDRVLTLSIAVGSASLLTFGYLLTSRYGWRGMVGANYIPLSAIPVIISLYGLIREDLLRLAGQLAIVFTTSFAVIALVSLMFSGHPKIGALAAAPLIPICWYAYYRAFGNGVGREALAVILPGRRTASETTV